MKKVLLLLFITFLVCSIQAAAPATFSVTTTADSGPGSLRQAILDANANTPANDLINFYLGGCATYSIVLVSALPILTDNSGVTIDGFSQTCATANTNSVSAGLNTAIKVVVSNGNTIPVGLAINSSNNIIKGLSIPNFGDGTPSANDIGISITSGSNQILGCYIGVGPDGSTAYNKTYYGIYINNCASNTIGNGSLSGRNLISGMYGDAPLPVGSGGAPGVGSSGIFISGAAAVNNIVKTNIIGLKADGMTAYTYTTTAYNGILIKNAGSDNVIGGAISIDRNLISGNAIYGIVNMSSVSNIIKGNVVGLAVNGLNSLLAGGAPTYFQEIGILVVASNNIIGGNSATERNIASGNDFIGIHVSGNNNTVIGNYCGLDISGTLSPASGQDYGIYVQGSFNKIGETGQGEGNVCSGANGAPGLSSIFGFGICLELATTNTVIANICGLQKDGSTKVGGQSGGILLENGGTNDNVIGGTTSAKKNICSGNLNYGIELLGASNNNIIIGNYIGCDSSGTTHVAFTSQDIGIYCWSGGNTIGGSTADSANVISGQNDGGGLGVGILFDNSLPSNNRVVGNIIGLRKDGKTRLTNNLQACGIRMTDFSGTNNLISKNVISGNDAGSQHGFAMGAGEFESGIEVYGGNCTITGNIIGLDSTGTAVISAGLWGGTELRYLRLGNT